MFRKTVPAESGLYTVLSSCVFSQLQHIDNLSKVVAYSENHPVTDPDLAFQKARVEIAAFLVATAYLIVAAQTARTRDQWAQLTAAVGHCAVKWTQDAAVEGDEKLHLFEIIRVGLEEYALPAIQACADAGEGTPLDELLPVTLRERLAGPGGGIDAEADYLMGWRAVSAIEDKRDSFQGYFDVLNREHRFVLK
jgi:hypothetical protein